MWNGIAEVSRVPRYEWHDFDGQQRLVETGILFIHEPCAISITHPSYPFRIYVDGIFEMLEDVDTGKEWVFRHTCRKCGAKFIFPLWEGY